MKRVNISITEKYKLLQKIEEGKRTKSVAEEYNVKKNAILAWITNRTKVIAAYESGQVNPNWKKLKKSDKKHQDKLFLPGSRTCIQTKFLLDRKFAQQNLATAQHIQKLIA